MLKLYTIFHLNLAYSSIEEEQRSEVIQKCYWPLLRLARTCHIPFGLEASGYTLEKIAAIDPAWIQELRHLLTTSGSCEFIGSGYAQIIGPLVPPEVNTANLRLGHQVYNHILGFCPQIALVNEQAYSSGLILHYLGSGYKAIVMEWDNPASCHTEWPPEWRYLPQYACSQQEKEIIPLIWNKSIAFQKFQRYAHGDMELDEYLSYLHRHRTENIRAFPLYGNDIEIFDFRPGRYHTEAALPEESEWLRIEYLFKKLRKESGFDFIRPSQVLELLNLPGAGNRLHLESSSQPIPVKKQGKYNITRWAVTGRNSLGINTACFRIYERLKANSHFRDKTLQDEAWRRLCYLWSSDFRTHITEKRWIAYLEELADFERQLEGQTGNNHISKANPLATEKRLADKLSSRQSTETLDEKNRNSCTIKSDDKCSPPHSPVNSTPSSLSASSSASITNGITHTCQGRYLIVETKILKLRLNMKRGLAFDGLWFKEVLEEPLIGTIPHGYYDDINLSADYYTGHLIFESPGQPKVTDLNPVKPLIDAHGEQLKITGIIQTPLGPITKEISIFSDIPWIDLTFHLEWKGIPQGSLRLGYITLNPAAFKAGNLFYNTHNGGYELEKFGLADAPVDHGQAVSFLVSAGQCLGITSGVVEIGDKQKYLHIEVDKTSAALIGLITYRQVGQTYFARLGLSAQEMDETRIERSASLSDNYSYRLRITGRKFPV